MPPDDFGVVEGLHYLHSPAIRLSKQGLAALSRHKVSRVANREWVSTRRLRGGSLSQKQKNLHEAGFYITIT